MYLGLRIVSLYLENFELLESGLKKNKIFIDLSDSTHPINVFTGKIGSGKTFILSHLQPFATLGTLDVRNQDDQIIPYKDGLKIICYQSIDAHFQIRHEYIWNEKSMNHTTKSYIEKNGEELNPTGNVTSFKYIISTEFGLEQANMRLLRLGQNVSGLLEYSITERKTYVASLIESADAILALHKSFREELRNYNAQVSVLTNKLTQIGMDKESEYELEIEEISDKLKELEDEIKEKEVKIIEHEAEIMLIAPNGFDALMKEIEDLMNIYDDLRNMRNDLQTALVSLEGNEDIESLMKHIGALENEKSNILDLIDKTEDEYTRLQEVILKTEEDIRIIQNDQHLQTLKDTYLRRKSEVEAMQRRIIDFNCRFSSSYLKNLITDLHGIDLLINDIGQYDNEIIQKCYLSDASIISWAKKKGEILTGRKVNLQKKMNNLSFSATYSVVGVMYTPPFCPTEDCPFKKTHPYTLAKGKSKSEINREVEEIREEIDRIDRELYVYAEIPTVYTKVTSLKEKFREMMPILKSIGCLLQSNALQIMTRIDRQRWYNYDKIIDTQELALIKESCYEALEQLRQIEDELKKYESNDLESLTEKKSIYQTKLDDTIKTIEEKNSRKSRIDIELESLHSIYHQLLEKSTNEEKLKDLNNQLDQLSKEMSTKAQNADRISPYVMVNNEYRAKIRVMGIERDELLQKKNQLIAKLNDLKYTKQEMTTILQEQKYLSQMVSATSSKEGIPLEMINEFVSGCKDTANDLLFDIFEEDIMLEDFKINEKEFYIPYSVNGKYIQDVTKASQGQRSLFSIAIAFSFSQELKIPYNIPLLDEVDGPLHKPEQSKFLSMLLRWMKTNGIVQMFLITHSTLENLPVNFIATTEEDINLQNGSTLIKLYE